jgi:hypothetical protein
MYMRSLLAACLVALGTPAAADFEVVSEAYEVSLADLRLPGTANGTVTFRECDTCAYRTIRVTAATRYEANDHTFTLQDFRMELEGVTASGTVTATVVHHLESDTIKAIHVWF